MSKKHEFTLKNALLNTGVVQPVESSSTSKSVSVLCRSVPGQDPAWVKAMESILQSNPTVHLCKKFVMKNGSMVFGWHIFIESKSAKTLEQDVHSVCEILSNVSPSLEPATPAPKKPSVAGPTLVPRPPNEPAAVQEAPSSFVFSKRTAQRTVNQKGEVTIIEEMPIPHVYSEMNRPNSKGKGAKSIMEG